MSNRVYLLLGSNLGDREQNLEQARQAISREVGPVITASALYKTAAWGNQQQPEFINQVLEIRTELLPDALMTQLLVIEKTLGRVREARWSSRTIDLDILYYNDACITTALVTIPHPQIANRRFTLMPLVEIAPDLVDPVHKKNIRTLLKECADELPVERL